jgi:hypothetical protein
MNNKIHKYRYNNNKIHLPITGLSKFKRGAYFSVMKVFNHLPEHIQKFI